MTTAWHWWYEAWETHMDGFLPARDSVLDLLCELLADLTGPAPRILEVGSGTGSLAARAVTHLPDATVVGVDLDPLLQAFGEHVLGDLGGRLRRHDADLRANDWHHGLTGEFDAVISVAALHMLGADDTTRVLTDLGALLRPDGVLLDLDWATPEVETGRLASSLRRLERRRNDTAAATVFSQHRLALASDPELARLDALRRDRFGTPPAEEPTPLDAAGHRRALLDAGFLSVVEVWRHLDLTLIAATR